MDPAPNALLLGIAAARALGSSDHREVTTRAVRLDTQQFIEIAVVLDVEDGEHTDSALSRRLPRRRQVVDGSIERRSFRSHAVAFATLGAIAATRWV